MGPKRAKALLQLAAANAVQENVIHGDGVDFVETEAQLPSRAASRRMRYTESLTMGRDGFILTPGSALMNEMGKSDSKALDPAHGWESPVKF